MDTWIKEKTAFVSSADYGKDESASDKLLAKHKVGSQNYGKDESASDKLLAKLKVDSQTYGKNASHVLHVQYNRTATCVYM